VADPPPSAPGDVFRPASPLDPDVVEDAVRQPMPPWIPRLLLLIALFILGLALLYAIILRLREFLTWIFISLFLSFALEPAVNWLSRRGLRRGPATGLSLLVVVLMGGLLVGTMVPLVIDQVGGIVTDLPGWLERISAYTDRWFGLQLSSAELLQQLKSVQGDIASYAGNLAGNLLGIGAAVVGVAFALLTIIFFTFYFVAEGPKFRRALLSLLRPAHQKEVLRAWEIAIEKTGGYFYSRLLVALLTALVTFIALEILGVPFPVPLALWMGVLSAFLPVVGTYVGAAVPIVVAFLERPWAGVILIIFTLMSQQLLDYVVTPRLTARTMALHPAVALGSVIVGGALLGPMGAFLALPVAATVQASVSTYLTRYAVVESDLTREEVPSPGAANGPPLDPTA